MSPASGISVWVIESFNLKKIIIENPKSVSDFYQVGLAVKKETLSTWGKREQESERPNQEKEHVKEETPNYDLVTSSYIQGPFLPTCYESASFQCCSS